jgi:hypothetical protein
VKSLLRGQRKRAVIHIGIDKTGSKTIQKSLYTHRDRMLESNVLVPSLNANLSVYLMAIFGDRFPRHLPFFDSRAVDAAALPALRREYQTALEADLRKSRWETVVLSAEGLSGFVADSVARLKSWLESLGVREFSIVAYVREPIDWTRSSTQQEVKQGRTLEDMYANPKRPDWRRRLSPWLDTFGRQYVSILPFEDARRDGILATFCGAARIPQPEPEPRPQNEAMSMEATLLLSHLNRCRPLFEDGKRSTERAWLGTDVIKTIPGSPFVLPQDVQQAVFDQTRDDVRWLNELLGVSLYEQPKGFGEPRDEQSQWPDATLDALARILSDLGNASVGAK